MLDRFFDKVQTEPNTGCWLWTGCTNESGYGRIYVNRDRKSQLAHRLSYEIHVGEIPKGKELDHLCRVRCCVNPDHLEPVTDLQNYWRGLAPFVHTSKTHCPKGHPYSGSNLYVSKNRRRHCRECQNIRRREKRASLKKLPIAA